MSLLLVGLSHKTAPVEVRERFAVPEDQSGNVARKLLDAPTIEEALVVSTCNRVEYLVRAGGNFRATEEIYEHLIRAQDLAPRDVEPFFYRYSDRDAIRHVFRVASSLDSMVVGEPQILGQVKSALAAAKDAGACGPELEQILTQAFRVARRVRNETGIGQMAVSISYVGVELAKKIFGSLEGRTILIIGAGKMSELAARHLRSAGAARTVVTNRTHARAVELADRFEGRAEPFDRLLQLLTEVDIVISSTGAQKFILDRKTAEGVIAARKNRPIFLVDIAVPRDLDPEINTIDNMFLYDIDDLQQIADSNLDQRRKEAQSAESIVEEEIDKLLRRLKSREAGPAIVSLQDELERVRQAELQRFRGKLDALNPEQKDAVEGLTRSLMKKVAHPSIVMLKHSSHEPDGGRIVEFVKRAFRLPQ